MTNFVNSEDVKSLFISLNEKPIVYHRAYAKITGSVTAGLLLSQIVYWWTTMQDQEFYKTNEDFRRELAMGDYELKAAKKKLKELNLVFITRKGIPAKTYYLPNISQIITRLTSWVETAQLDGRKPPNLMGGNRPTNTESTQRIHRELVLSEQGGNLTAKKEFGNSLVNSLTAELKRFNGIDQLDGSVKWNRIACKNVSDKIKKVCLSKYDKPPTDEVVLQSFTTLINSADEFHRKNLTNFDYINKHFVKILNSTKTEGQGTWKCSGGNEHPVGYSCGCS